MASKRRVRRKSCTSKRRYLDLTSAMASARNLKKKGYKGGTYKCSFCGGYHIGRGNKQVRNGINGSIKSRELDM